MSDTRKDRRAPVALKVRFKSATVDEFVEQYSLDISRGGIFIKTKSPMSVGTLLKFEFQLKDESRLIHGVGRVVWKKSPDDVDEDSAPGMGIKFIKMDPESRKLVDRIVTNRDGEPGKFDAGPTSEQMPSHKKTEAFFPAPPTEDELPAPEDRTQVRHASEFLASALSGADETAAAEAAQSGEAARKRTEEIERERAEAARRKRDPVAHARAHAEQAKAEAVKFAVEKEAAVMAANPPSRASLGDALFSDAQDERDKPEEDIASSLFGDMEIEVSEAAAELEVTKDGVSSKPPAARDKRAETEAEARLREAKIAKRRSAPPTDAAAVVDDEAGSERDVTTDRPSAQKGESLAIPVVLGIALVVGFGYFAWNQFGPGSTETAEQGLPASAAVAIEEEVVPTPEVAEEPTELPPEEELLDTPTEPGELVPAEPAVELGRVRVDSRPPGAAILVDGDERGTAPLELELPVGETVAIAARLGGHAAQQQEISVRAHQPAIRFRLASLPYVVSVESVPTGARAIIGSQGVQTPTELTVPVARGPIRLVVVKPGYARVTEDLPLGSFSEEEGRMFRRVQITLTEQAPRVVRRIPRPPAPTTMQPTSMQPTSMEPAGETDPAEPVPGSDPAPPPEPGPAPAPEPEPEPTPPLAPAPDPQPEVPENPFG